MAQLVASMSGVVLGGVVEVVGLNLARGKIFTASIDSVDIYLYIYIYTHIFFLLFLIWKIIPAIRKKGGYFPLGMGQKFRPTGMAGKALTTVMTGRKKG